MKQMIQNIKRMLLDKPLTLKETLSMANVKANLSSIRGNSCYIANEGVISMGKGVLLNSFPNGSMHQTAISTYLPEAEVYIGDNTRLNGTVIHCNEKILLGKDCLIGPGTIICDNDSHRVSIDYTVRTQQPISSPIIIEDNVWIGMNCLILKGVHIGKNAIIAAGSVVTKDIAENCVYGGNPAKLIKVLNQ